MAEYVLTGSRDWAEVKAAQNGDGTGTFWANSFLPFFDRLTTIAYYLKTDATVPDSGASLDKQTAPDGTTLIGWSTYLTYAAGTLRATLVAIIDAVEGKAPAAPSSFISYKPFSVVDGTYFLMLDNHWADQDDASDPGWTLADVDVKVGDVITKFEVLVRPVGDHVDLPSTMPEITLIRTDDSGVDFEVDSQEDPSDLTEYNNPHLIEKTLSHTVLAGTYHVKLTGESGSNTTDHFRAHWARVTYTPNGYKP